MNTRDPRRDDPAAWFTLLYVSELAADAAAVTEICAQSRVNNARDRITGVLVFDGQAFCQFVEGPEAGISALRERLELDRRHARMRVLEFGWMPGPRRFASWRLGFAYSADPAAIARVASNRDGAALAAFADWVPGLSASDS